MSKLKPCPFCGAIFEVYTPSYCKDEPSRKKARCSNVKCWAHFPDSHYDADELMELLNRSAANERVRELEEVLKSLLTEVRGHWEESICLFSDIAAILRKHGKEPA